eukprot:7387519-Prymnesium_polylepis.1
METLRASNQHVRCEPPATAHGRAAAPHEPHDTATVSCMTYPGVRTCTSGCNVIRILLVMTGGMSRHVMHRGPLARKSWACLWRVRVGKH